MFARPRAGQHRVGPTHGGSMQRCRHLVPRPVPSAEQAPDKARPVLKDLFVQPLTTAERKGKYNSGLVGVARARVRGGKPVCGIPPGAFVDVPEQAVDMLETVQSMLLMGTGQDRVDRRNIDVAKNEARLREVLHMGSTSPGPALMASGHDLDGNTMGVFDERTVPG